MKAVFVSYDQAHADDVMRALGHVQQRGFIDDLLLYADRSHR